MKRLIIVVEGESEERFVHRVLHPYLCNRGIYNEVQCFKIKHSHGGFTKYQHLCNDILKVLHEPDVIVSMMVDFYRLPTDFPGFDQLQKDVPHSEQVEWLENSMKADVDKRLQRPCNSFIPYIQLHEFETLFFAAKNGIETLFEHSEIKYDHLEATLNAFPNPEAIDNAPATAPSVRLKEIIPGYNKVVHGINIIDAAGMDELLNKCPHFRAWIERIVSALT